MGRFIKWLLSLFESEPAIILPPEDGSEVSITPVDTIINIPDIPLPDFEEIEKLDPKFHYFIDLGHGKLTKGKRSPILPDGRQLFEWKSNDVIGKYIHKKLTLLNIHHTIILPNKENVGNALQQRVDIANNTPTELPKIFISVHSNAGPVLNPATDWSTKFRGIEVWHYHGSKISNTLATIALRFLVDKLRGHNRGVKSKPYGQFKVLAETDMPAILTETYFYNNPNEVQLLLDEAVLEQIAQAHVNLISHVEKHGIKII